MSNAQKLLRDIQKYDFAMQEAALYLDTHSRDKDALKYFSYFRECSENAKTEYAHKFGPLQHQDHLCSDFWQWANGPWPWECEG